MLFKAIEKPYLKMKISKHYFDRILIMKENTNREGIPQPVTYFIT